MGNSMLEKGKKEKHEEQTAFAAYKQFCDDTTVEKNRDINEANDHIGVLKADIEKAVATIEKLSEEISELEEDVSIWEGDIKAATKMGEIENADYDKTHADSPNPSMRVSCVISSSFRCRSRVCRFTM